MKNFIAIILFTLALLFVGSTNAQNSWVQFTVQYDFYAPQESNFMFVSNATEIHYYTTPQQQLMKH